jgi:hypothetical protein
MEEGIHWDQNLAAAANISFPVVNQIFPQFEPLCL